MKTLFVQSTTPEADQKAAFTIMDQCSDDPSLKKVIWYSNIANLVSILEKRFDEVATLLRAREAEFARATQAALKSADRVMTLEVNYKSLEKDVDESKAWINAQERASKKAAQKDKKEKDKVPKEGEVPDQPAPPKEEPKKSKEKA